MSTRAVSTEQIIAEASDWLVRLQESGVSHAELEEFTSWLLRSPMHLEEYLAITRRLNDAGGASAGEFSVEALVGAARAEQQEPNVVSLKRPGSGTQWEKFRDSGLLDAQEDFKSTPSPFRKGSAATFGIAAALGLLIAGTWFVIANSSRPSRVTTAVGEQRSVTLGDGSIVYLNTDSQANVDFDARERRVHLSHGEARFSVAKDARRSFIVLTPQATVRAIGTVFNVRADAARTAVTVIEGRVKVIGPEARGGTKQVSVELAVGEDAAVTREGEILRKAGPSLERALAWTERRLVFRDDTLSDVVAEYNRYLTQPLRIDDPSLAGLRISGTFNAADPRSLIQYLERYERAQVRDLEEGSRTISH